jgi:hypothetical protein
MSIRHWLFLAIPCIGLGATAGCNHSRDACSAGARTLHMRYLGDLQGSGTIAYNVRGGRDTDAVFSVAVPIPQSDGTPGQDLKVELHGNGVCKDGQVRVVFGAAQGEIAERYRVLGGTSVFLLSPELTSGTFGSWQVDLHDAKENRPQKLHGFWEETHDAPAAHAELSPGAARDPQLDGARAQTP